MASNTITIFEDYAKVLPTYREHLHSLYAFKDVISNKNFSLQADGSFQVKHYVGFFQHGNLRLQILPKVYSKTVLAKSSESEIQASLDFVYKLLYWSGYLNIKKLSPQLQSSSNTDLLEIFINIFIDEFLKLIKRKTHRRYEQQEENQQFIKGKILFSETVRQNPILRHKHVVRYDNFTINNPLNQIFKSLIFKLLKTTTDISNKRKLVTGLAYLQDVDLVILSKETFKKIKFDRLNNEFEPIFSLAKLFFHKQQPGISSGTEHTFSFLVPLNLLFEKFLSKCLGSFSTKEIKYQYHRPQLFLGYDGVKSVFNLEPDFTVSDGDKCLCILDAKYKYPFNNYGKIAISTLDLYQLTTYAARYNCNYLVLIYPKFIGAPEIEEVLQDYQLKTAFGQVKLRVVQVDIAEESLDLISSKLKEAIEPTVALHLSYESE